MSLHPVFEENLAISKSGWSSDIYIYICLSNVVRRLVSVEALVSIEYLIAVNVIRCFENNSGGPRYQWKKITRVNNIVNSLVKACQTQNILYSGCR